MQKSEGERKEVGDQLCSGLCALAELYLTDLSDVEELDGKTIQHAHEGQRLLSSAQHLRPDNPGKTGLHCRSSRACSCCRAAQSPTS